MASGDKKTIDFKQLPSPPDLDESSIKKESKTVEVPVADKVRLQEKKKMVVTFVIDSK